MGQFHLRIYNEDSRHTHPPGVQICLHKGVIKYISMEVLYDILLKKLCTSAACSCESVIRRWFHAPVTSISNVYSVATIQPSWNSISNGKMHEVNFKSLASFIRASILSFLTATHLKTNRNRSLSLNLKATKQTVKQSHEK